MSHIIRRKNAPFYAMDDPEDPKFTLSFDLLFHGLEVTTGGQRIHDYPALMAKLEARGMEEEAWSSIWIRLSMNAASRRSGDRPGTSYHAASGEDNVREACLFPRDMSRLSPDAD